MHRNWYQHRFFSKCLAVLAFTGAMAPGCSWVIKQELAQCRTDLDCSPYLGTQCVQGGCVARTGSGLPIYPPLTQCSSTQECLADHGANWVCRPSDSTCISLVSQECTSVVGDYKKDNSLILGALVPSNAHQSTSTAMQNTLRFAIDDFARGLPPLPDQPQVRRPVSVVVCNETANPEQAVSFLIDKVQVPAILGASFSSATARIAPITTKAKVLLLSPTTTTNINDTSGLVWRMAPSDSWLAKATARVVKEILEPKVRNPPRNRLNTRLALLHKGDVFGSELSKELVAQLQINGASVTDPRNASFFIRSDYGDSDHPQGEDPQTKFTTAIASAVRPETLPDIVLIVGHTEGVTHILKGIEDNWPRINAPPKPFYLVSPGMLLPELLALFNVNEDLRKRTLALSPGVDPVRNSNFQQLLVRYSAQKDGTTPATFGAASMYDATYSMLYAIAALGSYSIVGLNIAEGLKRLSGPGALIDVGVVGIQSTYNELSQIKTINLEGASGPLDFNLTTRSTISDIQVWCGLRDTNQNQVTFESANLAFSADTMQLVGSLIPQCMQ